MFTTFSSFPAGCDGYFLAIPNRGTVKPASGRTLDWLEGEV